MNLRIAAIKILDQLTELVNQIEESDFSRSSRTLSGSTIGQHVRHTLEFFLCFQAGYGNGVINYDKRPHDKQMETDKALALATIRGVTNFISRVKDTKPLKLEVGYYRVKDEYVPVPTNSVREMVYNIEHAIHHMAIIKIAVGEIAPYIRLDRDFGVAASTIRFTMAGSFSAKTLS